MASPHAKYNVGAVLLLVFLLLLSTSPYSSARPLNNDFSFKSTGSTTLNLNLVLPSDGTVKEHPAGNASPCDRHVAGIRLVRGGKYGPLIMNMLPKGKIPPSGPSKGSNDINT